MGEASITKARNKKAICFIHGWGLGPGVWENFIYSLSADWQVCAFMMPGYDSQETSADVSNNIDAIVDHIIEKIPAKAILVGWSLGGLVATRLACRLGNALDMLILLASTPCFIKKTDWPCGVSAAKVQGIADQLSKNKDKALNGFISEIALGDESPRDTIKILKNLLVKNCPHADALKDGLEILCNIDLREELTKLDCKAGMILGENDHLVAKDTGPATQLLCPQMQLLTIGATGHAPFISQQEKTRQAIFKLIRQAV